MSSERSLQNNVIDYDVSILLTEVTNYCRYGCGIYTRLAEYTQYTHLVTFILNLQTVRKQLCYLAK